MLQEIEKNQTMVSQVVHSSFRNQKGCDQAVLHTGSKVMVKHIYLFCMQIECKWDKQSRSGNMLDYVSTATVYFCARFLLCPKNYWPGFYKIYSIAMCGVRRQVKRQKIGISIELDTTYKVSINFQILPNSPSCL